MDDAKTITTYDSNGEPFAVHCATPGHGCWPVNRFLGDRDLALKEATEAATQCCSPKPCDDCGKPVKPGHWCHDCRHIRERRRMHAAFAKATKVTLDAYAGEQLTDGDDYFVATEDVDDDGETALELDDGTRFLWGTTESKPSVCLYDECNEDWLQEHHEDAIDWVDHKKLNAAQKLVDEALAGVTTYFEDDSVAVLLPVRS